MIISLVDDAADLPAGWPSTNVVISASNFPTSCLSSLCSGPGRPYLRNAASNWSCVGLVVALVVAAGGLSCARAGADNVKQTATTAQAMTRRAAGMGFSFQSVTAILTGRRDA